MTGSRNKEHFVIWVRWVDKSFDTHEEFIGIYIAENIKADTPMTVIKDLLISLNILSSNARVHCYECAKNMCGIENCVSNKILSKNSKSFFTHCFGHDLNLAVRDTVKNALFLKDSMNTAYEISNLIKKSPKRDFSENLIRYIVRISRI